jgi:hypothetical protein
MSVLTYVTFTYSPISHRLTITTTSCNELAHGRVVRNQVTMSLLYAVVLLHESNSSLYSFIHLPDIWQVGG